MGEMLTLFGATLPAELQEAIRQRLRREFFDNFIERHDAHGWAKWGMNWNAVCHQGVLGAALTVEEDHSRLARMLTLAAQGLPSYLGGFAADGGTSEGPAYWEYGFGWFSVLNEQLETRTAGALSLFEGDAMVQAIARFGPQMVLSNGCLVNFSDGHGEGLLRPSLCQYLGERLDDAICRNAARQGYQRLAEKGIDLLAQRGDLFYLARLFLRAPAGATEPATSPLPDAYFPSLGVLVAHGRDRAGHLWEFAAKAGSNNEHHNHNDCGSYLLNIDGERCLIELGAPEYTRDYFDFGGLRYQFFAARSLGHPVPLINGCEQFAGPPTIARVLEEAHSDREARLVMDLAKCYPPEAQCRSCTRTFRLEKDRGVLTVTDHIVLDAAKSIETAIIPATVAQIQMVGGVATLSCGRVRLVITPLEGTSFGPVEKHTHNEHRPCVQTEVSRVVLCPRNLDTTTTLGYSISLKNGDAEINALVEDVSKTYNRQEKKNPIREPCENQFSAPKRL